MTDPTVSEIVRRLDEVTRSVERVASTLEASYVRREVYEARHEALKQAGAREDQALKSYFEQEIRDIRGDVTRIEDARKSDQQFRRQIMAGAAVGLILLLINLVLATSNFIARGGA